jgi:hypothetical protein
VTRMRQKLAVMALLAGSVLTGMAPRAVVAEEGRGSVCVYEHADYGGWEQCFGVGETIPNLGQRGDRISSIRIRGQVGVTLFQHVNFQGGQVAVNSDASDLGRWNDQASSLRVTATGSRDRRDSRRSFEGRRSFSEDRVCFYEHSNFQGRSECWDLGDDVGDLRSSGWNDRISSIRTFGRTRLAAFEDSNFAGQRLVVDREIADLGQIFEGRSSWNDRISSFRVSGGRRD